MTAPSDSDQKPPAPAETDESPVREGLTVEAFYDVLEGRERPVVTASEVARALDVDQADAVELLEDLAEDGRVEALDVEADPVVWYPRDYKETQRRERVEVFPNRHEVLVSEPTQFTRAQLAQFAHLVETNRSGGYRYRVREEDVWQAPYDDLEDLFRTMRGALGGRHEALEEWVEGQWERARKFRLVSHDDGYVVLEAASADLLGNVAQQHLDESSLRATISDTEAWVAEDAVSTVKRTLYDAGYPVADERELEAGEPLDVDLTLSLRDYQQDWVDRFLERRAGVLVGPPGSGKTVAALGVMAAIGGETLILVPGRELASQWSSALVDQTSLTEDQVGEYHGGEKHIRPVTVATYRTAGMDRHRRLFDEREWGLIVYDECLTGDTIIETPDGKTTFSKLDDEYEFCPGWNRGIDERVRTFDPRDGLQWTEVEGVYKTEAPVQRIETNTGHTIKATSSHTHLVFDPDSCKLREQKGVSTGDFLVYPLPHESEADRSESVRNAEAELTGWFIGDGHVNEYGHIKFSFAKHPEEQVDIIANLCERIGSEYTIFENYRGDLTLFAPNLRDKLDWSGETGKKTATVSVPPESYSWSAEEIGRLLRGLFDAEGSVDSKHRIQFNTVSSRLAEDVSLLLQKLGILTRTFEIQREDDKHSNVYRLTIPTHYNGRFRRLVGFRLDHKSSRVETGESPATGLPIGTYLEEVKSETGLTNQQIGELSGLSQQTIGDVIRGRSRLGQPRLKSLADGLSTVGNASFSGLDSARRFTGVTYHRLGQEIGMTSGGAYSQLNRGEGRAVEALGKLVDERQQRMIEHGANLDRLADLCFLEVTDVSSGGTEIVYDFETESHTFLADGFLTHNCHHIPSPIFSRSVHLQTRHRLGLSATPVREDDREAEIFTLIGPAIGTDWEALFEAGFVAEPEVEIRYVPWPDDDVANEYTSAEGHERRQLAASNPAKVDEVAALLREHRGQKALVFVEYLDQGDELAEALGVPFVSGRTPRAERGKLFAEFRDGEPSALVVSRVGDEGLDLPSAEVAIAASGLGGSRRQGAQRAGRTMRPVGRAQLYVLATRGTQEEEFARRRMRHLAGKGIRVREAPAAAWE